MADFPVKENPEFSVTVRKIETSDRGHPDTFNPTYQMFLDNDNYLKGETDRMKEMVTVLLPASGWSASAPYSQRVAVTGVRETDNPVVTPCTPKELTAEEVKIGRKMAGMITDGVTEDGYVTFYCGEKKPVADFSVYMKGVSADG